MKQAAHWLFLILAALSGLSGSLGLWTSADPSGWGVLPAIALARIGLPLSLAGLGCWAVFSRKLDVPSWLGLALLAVPWILLWRLTQAQ
ncbi:MAG TPA: hypothetical protein VF950_29205 [Planctomycetota bacterium]